MSWQDVSIDTWNPVSEGMWVKVNSSSPMSAWIYQLSPALKQWGWKLLLGAWWKCCRISRLEGSPVLQGWHGWIWTGSGPGLWWVIPWLLTRQYPGYYKTLRQIVQQVNDEQLSLLFASMIGFFLAFLQCRLCFYCCGLSCIWLLNCGTSAASAIWISSTLAMFWAVVCLAMQVLIGGLTAGLVLQLDGNISLLHGSYLKRWTGDRAVVVY